MTSRFISLQAKTKDKPILTNLRQHRD